LLITTFVIAVAAGCGGGTSTPPPPDRAAIDAAAKQVTSLADEYVTAYFDAFPYNAMNVGAEDRHPDQLADHSLPALAKWQAREDELSTRLRAIDVAPLEGRAEAITYKDLRHLLESAQRYRTCRMELWNVSPTYTSWQADLSVAAGQETVATAAQQKNALARYSQVPKYVDDEIANLKEGVKLGYVASKNNVRVVISQMDTLLAAKVADSSFVQMAPADAKDFRASLEKLEATGIRPAIKRYRDYLKNTYLAAAREPIGVSANPSGSACYTAAVNYYATVDMSPQQIHDLGRQQMEKILGEMRTIGARSFGTSDPAKLLILVKNDPKYRFKSREELIGYAQAAIDRAKAALPKDFGRLPKAPVIVEPYPPYLEKTATGGQAVPPTADGKPGKYLINAHNPTEQSKAGLESTAFHETYPGHHLQAAIALERTDLHRLSRYFFLSGFGEGWGLYSERLADEMGLFSSDLDRLGLLSNEALRAARLVVDSGMHGLGWSREQAVDYLRAHTTETADSVNSEINRYIAVPGQATAYMIGNLEIRRLRAEAEQKLGAKFDIREFHDLVLQDGTVPLRVLGEKVARWIASKK
jgi:uncharacterized protein (DUF885 family)